MNQRDFTLNKNIESTQTIVEAAKLTTFDITANTLNNNKTTKALVTQTTEALKVEICIWSFGLQIIAKWRCKIFRQTLDNSNDETNYVTDCVCCGCVIAK